MQLYGHPAVLRYLARVEDPKAADIFLRGLDSPYALVVAYSVQGLARLQRADTLPRIEKAILTLRPEERLVPAGELTWFHSYDASVLQRRLLPDVALRERWVSGVSELRDLEMKARAARSKRN